ncbi:MAG: NAD(P)H-hydrate epimerase [Anaerolineae bacterium]
MGEIEGSAGTVAAAFYTDDGVHVPAVTTDQMREVDRIAVEEFGLQILSMMENAGRNLSENAKEMLGAAESGEKITKAVVVLAGSGGNGGGGLACARHLRNRGFRIEVILDRQAEELRGAARHQLQVLQASGVQPLPVSQAREAISQAGMVVDALIGYGLRGAPQGITEALIELCNGEAARILSLDVPSGLDATTGESPGAAIHPERTLTLALPKTGLARAGGGLYLSDIGIPPHLYQRLEISVPPLFSRKYWIRLTTGAEAPQSAAGGRE